MKKTSSKTKFAGAGKTKQSVSKETSVAKSPAGRPKAKASAPFGDGGRRGEAAAEPSANAEEVLASQEELYRQQYEELDVASGVADKPMRINVKMIARRNLPPDISQGSHERLIEALAKLTHLRLDREHIGEVDNLEMMGPITNLYLQQNRISRIENLESLQSLRFLTLADNQIRRVENLNVLPQLRLLDLSSNQIQDLRTEELPSSLLILNLEGNPCTQIPNYRGTVLRALPNLKQLDGQTITRDERLAAGCRVNDLSSDEDEEDEEEEDGEMDSMEEESSNAGNDLLQLSASLIKESRLRSQGYTAQHHRHLEQLVEARSQSQLAMDTARAPSLAGTPREGRPSDSPSAWR